MSAPEAPFEEPWQAQLFALTVALNEMGHLAWDEWTDIFGQRVRTVEPSAYWQVWVEALIDLLEPRGIAGAAEVRAHAGRWQAAARATPHGMPIRLASAPRGAASPLR